MENVYLEKIRNNNSKEEYYQKIASQYKKATGIKKIDLKSKAFLEELEEWLTERKKILNEYKIILHYMGLGFDFPITAEIGKGCYDTVFSKDEQTAIITPYTHGINNIKGNKIIKGKIKIANYPKNKEYILLKSIDYISVLMTQNPYTPKDIKNWEKLYLLCGYHIITGIYGKHIDKDRDKKIMMLKELKEKLQDNCIDNYIEIDDDYYYIITTNKDYKEEKVKEKAIKILKKDPEFEFKN